MEKVNKRGVIFRKKIATANGLPRFLCQCPSCGETLEMWGCHFYRGDNPCGCRFMLKRTNERLYSIWTNMKTRCYNEDSPSYRDYGARGIAVCEEWRNDFGAFCNWALSNGYDDKLTLDRKENDKGYSPDNCRWATKKEQCANRRNTLYFDYRGTRKTLKEICDICGLNYKTEHTRLRRHGRESVQEYLDKFLELEGESDE